MSGDITKYAVVNDRYSNDGGLYTFEELQKECQANEWGVELRRAERYKLSVPVDVVLDQRNQVVAVEVAFADLSW